MRGRDAGRTGRSSSATGPPSDRNYVELTAADQSTPGTPAVVGPTVYSPGEAIDKDSGAVAWGWDASYQANATPALAHAHVFATEPGRTVALQKETGEERWSYDAGHAEASPLVLDDAVIVPTDQRARNVVALDASSGEELWRYAGDLGAVEDIAAGQSSVFVTGTTTDDDARLAAIDAETGEQQWTETLDGEVYVAPVFSDDEVYVGTTTGELVSFDAAGEERWRSAVVRSPEGFVSSRPALGTELVFVPANGGRTTVAVDRSAGDVVWEQETGITGGAPAVGEDLVYIGTVDGDVYALARDDGSIEWTVETPRVVSDVVLVASRLYLPHGGGAIGVVH